ncbi:radiation-inducible immediate-early gene IEX-1-like [Hemiscyllium ocellatum]|uniref:radiation-inducible immediate-early gene IEX-1-like n=1 Tax=Hemiscyllium ocellatum TaxID=170820 RepID=UPI0029673E54|nr:radiation-inducible immediate-early gene IEX-1-like [Hemiscyllium ocellatum]
MCLGCSQPGLTANAKRGFPAKQPGMIRQRSTEPEIFTFDIPPEVRHTADVSPRLRARRRPVKILYPAQVRKYLPPEKKDWAKRTLLLLLCVVTVQVYMAVEAQEGKVDAIAVATGGPGHLPLSDASGEQALVSQPSSVDLFPPTNGSAPQLPPKMPDGVGPAVTIMCHRMGSSSLACRM